MAVFNFRKHIRETRCFKEETTVILQFFFSQNKTIKTKKPKRENQNLLNKKQEYTYYKKINL